MMGLFGGRLGMVGGFKYFKVSIKNVGYVVFFL